MSISQDEIFKKCDELGEAKVREHINSNLWNKAKQKHAKEWLRQLEAKRSGDILSRQEAREGEVITIAKEANKIASDALLTARKNERWAMWAAIIATVAIIIAAMAYLKNP